MASIINKTPHAVNIVNYSGELLRTFPKSENPIRLSVSTEIESSIDGIATSRTVYGEAINLPECEEGVFYIVSQLVKNAFPNRNDLLVPAEMLRDENNNIIGCQSLGR